MYLFFRYVSSKAIDPATLDDARVMAVEVVCLVEETFPRTILTSQLHLIVHLVDEIALCGTVHARWMFFLERFMKTLKDFVRQSARPKGSMAEGWLIQESLVYISEFLGQVDSSLPRLWSNEEDLRMTSIVPQGKGQSKVIERTLIDDLNFTCILNSDVMSRWVTRYEDAKTKRQADRALFRRQHGSRKAYPKHLATLPNDIHVDWLHEEMERAERDEGLHITAEEWEYARGCMLKVHRTNVNLHSL